MKNKVLSFTKSVVPVILFNIIFFITWGFNNPVSVWVSYGLIHFAYALLVISPHFNKHSDTNTSSSFTNTSISLIYCILEFIAGLVFIILRMNTVNIALYVQLPLLAIYAIVIINNIFFNDKTDANMADRQIQVDFIRTCTLKIDIALARPMGENAKKKLTKARELMATSPCKSYAQAKPIEDEILAILDRIINEAAESETMVNLAERLITCISQRNLTLKSLH